MHQGKLRFVRQNGNAFNYQIKDPSVVALPEGGYAMYATTFRAPGSPLTVSRFTTSSLSEPWVHEGFVQFNGLEGPELCAPAALLEKTESGEKLWKIYTQNTCSQENGIIAEVTSTDGIHFNASLEPVATKDSLAADQPPIVGLYDAGISIIEYEGKPHECLIFTGLHSVGKHSKPGYKMGVGDIFVSLRDMDGGEWTPGRCVLKHEDLPFHNQRGCEDYEWGLEGGKLEQLPDGLFLMTGVCFLDQSVAERGHRQRAFMAASESPFGPFHPIGKLIAPTRGKGETGHPDTVRVDDKQLLLIYQERTGEKGPWHLRQKVYDLDILMDLAEKAVSPNNVVTMPESGFAERYTQSQRRTAVSR